VLHLAGDRATTRFALVLERLAAERGWRNGAADDRRRWLEAPVVGFAARSLDRLDRRVRRRGRRFGSLTPEKRHALRIALKHLRYATEFFGCLFHPASAAERYGGRAATLQDLLGELNDASIALRLIGEFDTRTNPDFAFAAGVAAGWCSRASVGDERSLTKAWRSLLRAERYWRSTSRDRIRRGQNGGEGRDLRKARRKRGPASLSDRGGAGGERPPEDPPDHVAGSRRAGLGVGTAGTVARTRAPQRRSDRPGKRRLEATIAALPSFKGGPTSPSASIRRRANCSPRCCAIWA